MNLEQFISVQAGRNGGSYLVRQESVEIVRQEIVRQFPQVRN